MQEDDYDVFDHNTRLYTADKTSFESQIRSAPPELKGDDLLLMALDVTYSLRDDLPFIKIYGATQKGHSVLVCVQGYRPYFYVDKPREMMLTEENIEEYKRFLGKDVVDVKPVSRQSIREYKGKVQEDQLKHLQIFTKNPLSVSSMRKYFSETHIINNAFDISSVTYESNIPFALRFMIDKDIVGMGWVRIRNYNIVPSHTKMSACQIEVSCHSDDVSAETGPEYDKIANLRIFSFDIEVKAEHGFPMENRKDDQVITIGCVYKETNQPIYRKVVLTLDTCAPIPDAKVLSFNKETDLLLAFQNLLTCVDPDILIGYNIVNFDLKYLIDRAKFLGLDYGYFGRARNKVSQIKNAKYMSKAMGMRETKDIDTQGRIQLDMMVHMHSDHKLSSYSLNNVCYTFLKEEKEDVHYSEIGKLQRESAESRCRLATYCLKDAELPLKLMEKLMCLYNYTEMARVTGVPINFLFTRGQQIKVTSQILRRAKLEKPQLIIPTHSVRKGDSDQVGYQGAFVLEPKPGYYQTPIATLDFASLYPSIMMAHNLCYTTLIQKQNIQKAGLTWDDVQETPMGHYFVKKSKKEGILPRILRELIVARKKAKAQLAKATDEMLKGVLQGRQLALKISANSVYGYTGATVGHLPCLQISSTVTSIGRQMIENTKAIVETDPEFENAQVIYGDTDSVMVKFPVPCDITPENKKQVLEQIMSKGRKAAAYITSKFGRDPIKLEFEKVYYPYLLITKKRYAGLYWTKPDKHDKMDKKGIQSVRRDNCLLVRNMLDTVLAKLLIQGDVKSIESYIRNTISDLLENKIDLSQLIITKGISKTEEDTKDSKPKQPSNQVDSAYNDKPSKNAYKVKQAHTELAQKMKKRDPNLVVSVGDRIPYIIIRGAKGSKNYQNAEDPTKVLEEDLPIDFDYYVERQIKPPLERMLKDTGIFPNMDIFFSGRPDTIRYVPKVNAFSALGKFMVRKSLCRNCKAPSDDLLCKKCENDQMIRFQVILKLREDYNLHKQAYADLWTSCMSCQGSRVNSILCVNTDCPIFYKRIKTRTLIKERELLINRMEDPWDECSGKYEHDTAPCTPQVPTF